MLMRKSSGWARRGRGFSLLEVMIALLVVAVGLLGMAGLLVISVRTNQSAYQRTQVTALAESMVNRMRANARALWAQPNPYNGNYPRAGNALACTNGAVCNFDAVAARDAALWSQELASVLPNATATIECTRNSATVVANPGLRPPYDGTCSMTVSWDEAPVQRGANQLPAQSFAWVFQP
jgi:type IV pilus assembly protein PilV